MLPDFCCVIEASFVRNACRIDVDACSLFLESGERLSPWVAVGCFTMGVSIIFF